MVPYSNTSNTSCNDRLSPSSPRYIWGLGLLASGNSSTMTGTLAGQHVMTGLLGVRMRPMQRVAVTRAVALGPALAVVGMVRGVGSEKGEMLDC